ncbi:uncharacterized protein LOC111383973 [Olea europaea var. sylvestris]|uniref:uncharacterized protein LOC111383973 n=1 Tax=Olea europaea var. sylvestris TaxID=158386 RepID=UPI000C1D7C8C|nr:uncharacterized protein LOC111383973 [Olea europaea var. sylvestris]
MFRFGSSFLISVYGFILKIFWFISKYVYRSKGENGSRIKANRSQSDGDQVVSKNSRDFETEKGNLEGSVSLESAIVANASKCQFISGKNVSDFMEEAKTIKFEMFVGSNEGFVSTNQQCLDSEILQKHNFLDSQSQENFQQLDEEIQEEEGSNEKFDCTNQCLASQFSRKRDYLKVNSQENLQQLDEEIQEEKGKLDSAEYENLRDEEIVSKEVESMEEDDQDFAYEIELLPENQFSASGIKQDLEDPGNENELLPGNEFLASDMKQDSDADENEAELLEEFLQRTRKVVESGNNVILHRHDPRITKDMGTSETAEECDIDDPGFAIRSSVVSSESSEDSDNEYIELEPSVVNSKNIDKESLYKMEESREVKSEVMAFVDRSQEEASNGNLWDSDSEDEDECDILLEHQHLVQQMKMELRNSRIKTLPTISEESETPKMVEDLKPLKIDHKFEYKDIMEDIQKFYKSYKERMRKLDILNYQTLHAISFLQLKDSEVFTSVKKKSALTLKPTWPMKGKRVYVDPTRKSIVEMHQDLELVYVGQLCLSWEILCWEYVKAKELLEYDAQGFHSYNRVAEEFQQFQVLMQRFMEDEPFQGPRIQNYVKNQCLIRSLLHVPIIKDDCLKDKKERREETDGISLKLLTEIIRGSMLNFWEFLYADKNTNTAVSKGVQGAKIDYQEPADSELMMDIITNLQKKERRLKEIARSCNCIVKKFQKHQEWQLNNALFTSRVELRLVSRVLSLSRLTTDQLVWCQKKLNNINFARRKVHVESSFSLFPC